MMAARTHQPSDACHDTHCYSHGCDEYGYPPAGAHLVCGECFHTFPTARHLRRDSRRAALRIHWHDLIHPEPRIDLPPDLIGIFAPAPRYPRLATIKSMTRWMFIRTRDITFCPHCIHDL